MQSFNVTTANNRILIIDDNPAIHDDFRKILCASTTETAALDDVMAEVFGEKSPKGAQLEFEIDSAHQGQEGLAKVVQSLEEGRPYAMAFVDVRMPPGWDGVETITRIWEKDSAIQVVICTAYSDFSWQEIVSRLGNSDRLVILKKPFDSIEVLQLAHAMTKKWLVTQQAGQKLEDLDRLVGERTRELHASNVQLTAEIAEREVTRQALKNSEERLSRAFNACPLPIAILRVHDHGCVEVNRAFLEANGFGRDEMLGRSPWDCGLVIDAKARIEAMAQLAHGKPVRARECRLRSKTGLERAALLWMEPFELANGLHLLAIVQDVSEQQKLEAELRQAQKMEAVGHLAAGVAHDLNNVLTVIEGHTSLQLAKTNLDSKICHSLKQVQSAGQRAAALTRQLLAFSRKQVMEKRAVTLSAVVTNVAAMLRRLIPENIALTFEHPAELPLVYADVCNLEQIIVNLVVNARDAMPKGGDLTVRTDTTEISAGSTPARTGHFVRLIVSDTGHGMDAETLAHIFEPFFTTKEVGKGTGMGLATVLGIVQQHEGWIDAESTPGQGTTFCVHFPVTQCTEIFEARPVPEPVRDGAREVILLVEDDADVRSLARCVLEEAGYHILEAADGHLAIAAWREFTGHIHLLLTDMVMPNGLSGNDVAECFRLDHPDSKILFSSGYNVELFGTDISLREGFNYLPKPYFAKQLTDAVSRALVGAAVPEAAVA